MYKVQTVADYFLSLADTEAGEVITHLKLQKLCYYAQGFSLAIRDEPMFEESIQAWQHGPVVPELWYTYRYAAAALSPPAAFDADAIDADSREVLDDVYRVYGQFSAWKLRELTHQEPPWVDAWTRGANTEITPSAMKEYFVTQLN